MRPGHCFSVFIVLFLGASSLLRAQPLLSGTMRLEAGMAHSAGDRAAGSLSGYLLLEAPWDLSETLALRLSGESGVGSLPSWLPSPWLEFPVRNRWDLETVGQGDGRSFARLSRASLAWAAGGTEIEAGMLDPDWGIAKFHRPTDVFFPLEPFAWDRSHPLASQGFRAKRHLFDDLSLEAAGRFLEGGLDEWVLRLEDKSVAYRVVPSYLRSGEWNHLGLELSLVLPDLRLWGEGFCRLEALYPDQAFIERFETALGASTVQDGATFTLEAFKDGTGRILGHLSADRRDAAYFFASVEKGNPAEWDVFFALVKSTCGGPFLLWPKWGTGFGQGWRFEMQAQLPVGEGDGALALMDGRMTASLTRTF